MAEGAKSQAGTPHYTRPKAAAEAAKTETEGGLLATGERSIRRLIEEGPTHPGIRGNGAGRRHRRATRWKFRMETRGWGGLASMRRDGIAHDSLGATANHNHRESESRHDQHLRQYAAT